jgi:aspartate racemase
MFTDSSRVCSTHDRQPMGILGGMGPLASVEFVRTIYYAMACRAPEAELPRIVLFSDPTLPDRTDSHVTGRTDELFNGVTAGLMALRQLNVRRNIICCVTAHHLLGRLPEILRRTVLSLVTVILKTVSVRHRSHLVVCTNGTRYYQIFEQHPLWNGARGYMVFPDENDQIQIHGMIYELKAGNLSEQAVSMLFNLTHKYRVEAFVAGCTEVHLLSRVVSSKILGWSNDICVDPLTIIAESICNQTFDELFEYDLDLR